MYGTGSLWDALRAANPYGESSGYPQAPSTPSLLRSISDLSPEEQRRLKIQGLGGSIADSLRLGQEVGSAKGQNPWVAALVAGLSAWGQGRANQAALGEQAVDKANAAAMADYRVERQNFDDQRAQWGMSEAIRREAEKASEAAAKERQAQLEEFKARQRMGEALKAAGLEMSPDDPRAKIALEQITRQSLKPKPEPHPLSTARGLGYVKDGKFQVIPGTEPIRQERRGRDPEVEADRDYNAAAAAIDRRIAAVTGNPLPKPEDAAWLSSMKDPAAKRAEIEREAELRTRRPRGEGADPLSSLGLKPGDPDAATAKQLLDNGMSIAEVKKLLEEARRARTGRK